MDETQGIQETQARITFEDVATAVADMGTTPQDTNASAVRYHLGRGGNTTIQKHLDQLRATHIEQAAPEDRVELPKETIQHLWNAAVAQAKATMAVRVDKILAEREAATALAAQAMKDRDAAFADAEQWEAKAAEADANAKYHVTLLNDERESYTDGLVDLQNSRADVFNENAQLKHTLEVLRLEHRIETDRLVQQLSDLKAMLHHNNAEPAAIPTPKKRGPKPKTDLGGIGGTTAVAD
jgi:hypothetical protein